VEVVEIPPFVTFFQQEREAGRLSSSARDQALETLREWHAEFVLEEKRVRELKRKIKAHVPTNAETASTAVTDVRSRGRQSIGRGTVIGSSKNEATSRRTVSGERDEEKQSEHGSSERRISVTGPNGLTGSYWDITIDEMGRGRRKTGG
jgi:hypothetical protein